jgi:predicted metal-dependent phosphoesterase TrpH
MNRAFDFHIHSKYSFDSFTNPQDIVKAAKKNGISGIAITDHNTVKGSIVTKKYMSKDFIVISGAEINSEVGHICALFITEDIKSKSALEIIDEIHNQNGLAVLAHPFKSSRLTINEDIIKEIDAIEVFNSRTKQDYNQKAYEFAAKMKKPFTAGSDAHFLKEIGNTKLFLDDISDEEDIRYSILKNRHKKKGGEELKLKENPAISQSISPFYFKTASRINANLKNGTIYKLPYTIIKSFAKDL